MLSVAEALARIVAGIDPLPAESVSLADAYGRVLAADLIAKLTQPPFRTSAMDGYSVRRADVETLPARLKVIGESAAGHPYDGSIGVGEAVRTFTGAAVPDGADEIIIQEDTTTDGEFVDVRERSNEDFVRPIGLDFAAGQLLMPAGHRLTARDLMLAAQANYAELSVRQRPRVAILSTGDELVEPGQTPAVGQIVSSIPAVLGPLVAKAGGTPLNLGIARDTMASLAEKIEAARDADILVTIGGASVGDHDLVRAALETAGFAIGFHKIAMRPGKPLMYGARGGQKVMGLPGNPVSATLCAYIFLIPLIAAHLGQHLAEHPQTARLAAALPANGPRQAYMRARFVNDGDTTCVEALPAQDSSLVSRLAAADCLIIRPPHAPATKIGDIVPVLSLDL